MKFVSTAGVLLLVVAVASAAVTTKPSEKLTNANVVYDYKPTIIPREKKAETISSTASSTGRKNAPDSPILKPMSEADSILALLKGGGMNQTDIEKIQAQARPPTYMIDAVLKYLQPEEITKMRAAFGPTTGNVSVIYLEAHMNAWEHILENTEMTLGQFSKIKARLLAEKDNADNQGSPFYDPSYSAYLSQVQDVVNKALNSVLDDVKNLSEQAAKDGSADSSEKEAIENASADNLDENTMAMFDQVLKAADAEKNDIEDGKEDMDSEMGDVDPEEFQEFLASLKPEEKHALLGIKDLLNEVQVGPSETAPAASGDDDQAVPVEVSAEM